MQAGPRPALAPRDAELAALRRQLAQANPLAELGRSAAQLAHDIRNSLVPVTLHMGLLRRRLAGDADASDILAKVEAGFSGLQATLEDLLHFAGRRTPRREAVLVRELVDTLLKGVAPRLAAQRVTTSLDVSARHVVQADAELLRRATLNLILNALDAMPQGGELSIISHAGRTGFELEIADSGPGIPAEQRARVFEPFYSTKTGGTGLGLAVVRQVAESHGGSVSCLNCPQGGAAFILSLPRAAAPQAVTQAAAA